MQYVYTLSSQCCYTKTLKNNRSSSKHFLRDKGEVNAVAYPRGGNRGVWTPTFLKYDPRDLSKNDLKLIGGVGCSILYACVNNNYKILCSGPLGTPLINCATKALLLQHPSKSKCVTQEH